MPKIQIFSCTSTRVGGAVQSMCWEDKGERLAIIFTGLWDYIIMMSSLHHWYRREPGTQPGGGVENKDIDSGGGSARVSPSSL